VDINFMICGGICYCWVDKGFLIDYHHHKSAARTVQCANSLALTLLTHTPSTLINMRSSALFASLLLPFAVAVLADPHAPNHARHHHDIARRASGDVELHKRTKGARATFYAVGLGACGKTNQPNDFIVALNSPQYGGGSPGPQCFKRISITCNGKTADATIMDECPGCPFGGLDMSEGLFKFFGPLSAGVMTCDWDFSGGGGGGGDSKPEPKHDAPKKPSPSHEPPPKTTTHSAEKKKPTSTSTKSSSSEKHTTSSHKAVTTSSSVNLKAASATGPAVPSGTIKSTPNDPESINVINQAVLQLGYMVSKA